MNENEVEQKLHRYGESLGRSTQRVRTFRTTKYAFVLAPITVAGACAIVLFWPGHASAAALKRLSQAITNATSMDSEMYFESPSGRWDPWLRVSYDAGRWRTEGTASPQMACTFISRDGLFYEDFWSQKEATLRNAADAVDYQKPPTQGEALEIVQEQLKSRVGHAAELSVVSSPDVAGRAAYRVVFQNPDRQRHGEIVVDQDTDLPISAQVWGENPRQHSRWDYHFNVSFPKGFFDPRAGRRIVDLRKTIPAREARWSPPVASVKAVNVLDACVTPDGTVWLATKGGTEGSTDLTPTHFSGAEGVHYTQPVQLSSRSPKGKEIRIYGFMPLSRSSGVLRRCAVSFNVATRSQPIPNSDNMTAGQVLGTVGTVSIPLRLEPTVIPAYFADLGVEEDLINLPFESTQNKARALEQLGRFAEAASIYLGIAQESTSQFGGFFYWRTEAARCYAKAGDKAAVARIEGELARAKQDEGSSKP